MASDRFRVVFAAAAVGSLLHTLPALAAPTSADRETARMMMQQGRELRAKGDLKEALKRFKAADDIMHVPTTSLELARVQVALGMLVEARDTIAAIRQEPEKPNDPEPFKDARVKAQELDASLNGRVPALTIVVHGATDDAKPEITVDGVQIPPALIGLPRSVDPGHHVIVATTSNGEGKQEADVREGERKQVDVTLVVTKTAEPPPASTPPPPSEPEPAEPTTMTSHGPTALTWVGLVVAGVGVAAGAVTGVMSWQTKASLESACPNHVCPPSSYNDYDTANLLATISTASFIGAGVGAGVAIVSLVVGHTETSPAPAQEPSAIRVRAVPWVGLGSAGLRGTF